eukprot:CAMPEP_0168327850 /NCGR_PEP_ID=MMETSP0213-20121227/6126_1 /TAXON_ID=151035 /ORGANISM="Euplotes harpa, Strain FSP1.4" /LENGTH=151 /DNA_ID=CAMNT_0008330799 /DNA_START=53 /DNA_END=508 /DNA_ORIENTATION=+
MCLTRKVLRIGMPFYLGKEITERFIAACYEDKVAFDESMKKRFNYQVSDVDESKLILEEIKKEQQFESNVKDSEVEKTLESVQIDKELQKLEHFIQGSPTGVDEKGQVLDVVAPVHHRDHLPTCRVEVRAERLGLFEINTLRATGNESAKS